MAPQLGGGPVDGALADRRLDPWHPHEAVWECRPGCDPRALAEEMGWDGAKRFQVSIPPACGPIKEKPGARETPDPEATPETPPPMRSASRHLTDRL